MSQNGFGFRGPIGPIPGLGGQGMNLTGTQRSPEERLSAYLKARATNPSMPLIPELETLARKQADKTANASGRLGMAYLDSAEIQIAERLKAEAPVLEKTTPNLLGQIGGWLKKTISGFGKKPEIAPADTVDANIIRNTRSALREATTQAEGSMANLAAAEARLQPPSLSERVSAGMGKLAASEEAIGQRLAKEAAAAAKKNQPTTGERVTGWLKNTLAGFGKKPAISPADTANAKIVRDTRQALLQTPTQAEGSMAALARFEEGLHSVAPVATAAPAAVESTLSGGVSTRLRGALAPVKVPGHLPLNEQLAINHAAASGGFTPHPATGAWNVAEPVVEQKTGLITKVTQWIETKAVPELSSRWEKLVAGVKHAFKPNPHSGAGEMEALMHHPEADRIAETLLDKAPQVHVPEVAAAPVTEAVTASAKKGGSLLGSLRERFNWKKPTAAVAETAAAPVERVVAPIAQAVEAVAAPVRGYVEPSQRILAQRAKTPNIHGEKEATIFKNIASHIGKNKGMYAVGAVGAAIVGAIAMSGNNKNRDAVLEREATGQDASRAS